MEDLLVLILQGLGQMVFEILAYLPWDLFWYGRPFGREESRPWLLFSTIILGILVGSLLGWISLHFFPDVFVHWAWLRMGLLFLSPLGSGFLGWQMAEWRREKNAEIDPWFHFWISVSFSVGLVWMRFAFAHRP